MMWFADLNVYPKCVNFVIRVVFAIFHSLRYFEPPEVYFGFQATHEDDINLQTRIESKGINEAQSSLGIRWVSSDDSVARIIPGLGYVVSTLPETNIAPENWWLEY